MNNLCRIFSTRILFALFFLLMLPFGANAQKDILLYSTNFSDWTAMAAPSSNATAIAVTTGGGVGFVLNQKPSITPSGTLGSYSGGYYDNASSSHTMTIKPLTFVSGGIVEVTYYNNQTSQAIISLSGVTPDAVMIESITTTDVSGTVDYSKILAGTTSMAMGTSTALKAQLNSANLNTWITGNTVSLYNAGAIIKLAFRIPSITGSQTIGVANTKAACPMTALSVYTAVGSTKYVTTTDYPPSPTDSFKITGTVGGSIVSKTANVKGWNITGPVSMSIVGEDSLLFSFVSGKFAQTATLSNLNATQSGGTNVPIYFTPSVKAGVSHAQLKLTCPSDAGANVFYMNILGLTATSTTTPQITANTDTIAFWTSLIAPISNSTTIAGVNLTGPITLSLTGANASDFTVSVNTITKSDALGGESIMITFLGSTSIGTEYANLVLTSPGAAPVTIPLEGITAASKPATYTMSFSVSPSGTGVLDINPMSARYLSGSAINVTVTPQTNWHVKYWSDASGSTKTKRTLTVSESKAIIVYLDTTAVIPPPTSLGSLTAYVPTYTSGVNTGFTLSWSAVTGATAYTVKVYDSSNTLVSPSPYTISGTNLTITGLTPGSEYYYSVETTVGTTTQNSGEVGPFKTTGTSGLPFTCGQ